MKSGAGDRIGEIMLAFAPGVVHADADAEAGSGGSSARTAITRPS